MGSNRVHIRRAAWLTLIAAPVCAASGNRSPDPTLSASLPGREGRPGKSGGGACTAPANRWDRLRPGNDLRHNDVVKNMSQPGAGRAAAKNPASRVHAGAEQSTRARVARLIMENGQMTAAALGKTLGL